MGLAKRPWLGIHIRKMEDQRTSALEWKVHIKMENYLSVGLSKRQITANCTLLRMLTWVSFFSTWSFVQIDKPGASLEILIDGCKIPNQLLVISIDGCKLPFKPCFNKNWWEHLDLTYFKIDGYNCTHPNDTPVNHEIVKLLSWKLKF